VTVFLGIDQSLSNTAICVMDREGKHSLRTIDGKRVGSSIRHRIERYETICAMLAELAEVSESNLDFGQPSGICIEGYAPSFGRAMQTDVIELGYHLRLFCHMKWPDLTTEIPPATLKQWASGVGNADKVRVASALTNRYRVEFGSSDEADAYALARMAMQIGGAELPATDFQRQAIHVAVNGKPKPVKTRKGKA